MFNAGTVHVNSDCIFRGLSQSTAGGDPCSSGNYAPGAFVGLLLCAKNLLALAQ